MNWMFWRHLKAEDFVNLMEGERLSAGNESHLRTCAKCTETLKSVQDLREQVAYTPFADDDNVVEPNWEEFRSGVRSTLLSRSVQRERSRQDWFGDIAWKPALAWGMSLVFVVGITSGLVLNSRTPEAGGPTIPEQFVSEDATIDAETAASMTRVDIFDQLLQLSDDEAASLERLLLEDLSQQGVSDQ